MNRARRSRPGPAFFARFLALSALVHAALFALPAPPAQKRIAMRAGELSGGLAAGARSSAAPGSGARLLSAQRGSFLVVDWRLLEKAVAHAAPRREKSGEPDAARESRRAGGGEGVGSGARPGAGADAFAAFAAGVLSGAIESAPRPRGEGADEAGRLTPPVPLAVVWPEYPASARRVSGGTVLVRVHVTRAGTVDSVEIARPLADEALDRAVAAAARRLLFEPARVDGLPVEVWYSYPVTFTPGR